MVKVSAKSKSKSKPERKPERAREPRIAIIGTSDRNAFRSCRRKWGWSSHLKQSLSPIEQRHPLWFGSGMHHVLEDFHGHKLYATPAEAIDDYIQATVKHHGAENLPETLEDDTALMKRMMQHYVEGWLKLRNRDPLKTYVHGGVPQVEVSFEFEIPVSKELLERSGYDKVIYRGTFDRIVVDSDGYLWIQDYKNVAQFTNPTHLELDSQIGAYLWAASFLYKRPVIGFIYTQFLKRGVEAPLILKNGDVSTNKTQSTSHALYLRALHSVYGDKWSNDHMTMLNYLASMEEEEADKYIRRDRVPRTKETLKAEADKILAEVSDMLDPKLRMYPNPSFMCQRMCSFVEPCIQMDRGENYKTTLEMDYEYREYSERNEWRRFLKVGAKVGRTKEQAPVKIVGSIK